ncbi:MAG: hypothetical protein A2X08_15235 [Bacteroidetes bacterium GWA2_32_17]|nr:MAG: hypothetical protein A2X08_15235 [Bacteroidetes bacterium GWA2_32_17]
MKNLTIFLVINLAPINRGLKNGGFMKKLFFVLFICLTMMLNGYSQLGRAILSTIGSAVTNEISKNPNASKAVEFVFKTASEILKDQAIIAYRQYIEKGRQDGWYTADGKTFFVQNGVVYLYKEDTKTFKEVEFTRGQESIYHNLYYGIDNFDKGNFNEAELNFTQVINMEPKSTTAYYTRGIIYGELNQYEKAISDFTEAIKINPTNADMYNARGLAYILLKEYDKAKSDFTEAIKINPKLAVAYLGRGCTYFQLQQNEEGIKEITEALNIDPTNVFIYIIRGYFYELIKKYDNAIADYTQAMIFYTDNANIYYARARAYNELGKNAEADKDLKKYEELSGSKK